MMFMEMGHNDKVLGHVKDNKCFPILRNLVTKGSQIAETSRAYSSISVSVIHYSIDLICTC